MANTTEFRSENARLITRTSAARVGVGDYITKRNFRRDLDQDLRREGEDYFWPNMDGDFAENPGGQPFPNMDSDDPTGERITLVHLARRPNGKHAVIVGTQTKLWRFFGAEAGAYYEGTGADAYFEEAPAADAPYYADSTGVWQLIGSGFSEDGHRWEALNINGYAIFNNGVDLPMTYRIEESEVVPIYELREQGIACVETISETNGILVCANVTEIRAEDLAELLAHVGDIDGGNMTASKPAGTNEVNTPADFFTDGTGDTLNHDGRWIVWEDGTTRQIQSIASARQVTISGDAAPAITSDRFRLRNKASQAGATFSGLTTADVTAEDETVTADSAVFDSGMVGKTIRFSNGFSSEIASFTDSTHIEMEDAPDEAIEGLPFWITNDDALVLESDADVFTEDMEGLFIVFDNGEVRQIVDYVTPKQVVVDIDSAVASEFFTIENPDAYGPVTNATQTDRVQYRKMWGMPDEPRRWGALVPCTIEAGSQEVELAFPCKGFEAGQEVVLVGAGVEGGNLTTTILSVTKLGQKLLLADAAVTSVDAGEDPETDDGFIIQSDAQGSIVGFEDLQDDSSAIIRMMPLGESTLVIYKDTCIFIAIYTGLVDEPFRYDRISIPEAMTLHYRWTLVDVGGQFHLYAGANSFYRFDLGARVPTVVSEMDMIGDKFFGQVTLADEDEVFAADNGVTNEVFLWFPSDTDDKAICYDYKHNSVSTTDINATAAATVKKPMIGQATGATEDLFVMGNRQGTVLVYGKADQPQESFGNAEAIYYRRSAYPFNSFKGGYESVMESGWGDFGAPHHEKDLSAYVLYLASQSPDCQLTLTIYGNRNPNDEPVTLVNYVINSPKTQNLVSMFYRHHYFKYKIAISGRENPCRITGHTFDVDVIGSASHERRAV